MDTAFDRIVDLAEVVDLFAKYEQKFRLYSLPVIDYESAASDRV
jgi:hypothetical protein